MQITTFLVSVLVYPITYMLMGMLGVDDSWIMDIWSFLTAPSMLSTVISTIVSSVESISVVSHHALQLLVGEVYSLVFWAAKGSKFVIKVT